MKAPFTEINVSNKVSSKTEDKKGKPYDDELSMTRKYPSDEDFEKVATFVMNDSGVNMVDLQNAIGTLQEVLAKLKKRTGAAKSKAILAARKKVAENAEKVLELYRQYNELNADFTETRERITFLERKGLTDVGHIEELETKHPSMEKSIILASSDEESSKLNASVGRGTMMSTEASAYSDEDQREETTEGIEANVIENKKSNDDCKESIKLIAQVPIITFNSLECEVEWNESMLEFEKSNDWTFENDEKESGKVSGALSNDWSTIVDKKELENFPLNTGKDKILDKQKKRFTEAVVVPTEIQVCKKEGKDKAYGPDATTLSPVKSDDARREKLIWSHASTHGVYTGDVIDGYFPDIVIQKKAPKGGCFSSGIEYLCCFGGASESNKYRMTFHTHSPIFTMTEPSNLFDD